MLFLRVSKSSPLGFLRFLPTAERLAVPGIKPRAKPSKLCCTSRQASRSSTSDRTGAHTCLLAEGPKERFLDGTYF